LEKRAEPVLPGSEEGEDKGEGGRGKWGEMTHTMYTHMNKQISNKKTLKKVKKIVSMSYSNQS
jgi:hypothetical protein